MYKVNIAIIALASFLVACAQVPSSKQIAHGTDCTKGKRSYHRSCNRARPPAELEGFVKPYSTEGGTAAGPVTRTKSAPQRIAAPFKTAKLATLTNRGSTKSRRNNTPNPSIYARKSKYDDVWMHLGSQLSFRLLSAKREVEIIEQWYAKHGYYLEKVSPRAGRYIYYVMEQLEKRKMPIDIALLPLVESAYDPFAYSQGNASGLWQIVPNTAKHLKLKSDWWYDGRRDVVASTKSALDYLSYLNKRFDGDWLLTFAAYNAGRGTINKAIRKNRKKGLATDFWSLDLPKETERYIPKLLAFVKIFSNPASYNIKLHAIPDQPQFSAVTLDSQLDLRHAASMANISVDEIHRLNPGFNRRVTPPNGPHRLLIPVERAEIFSQRLASTPMSERVRWKHHKVVAGENLSSIAKDFHISLASLRDSNHRRSDKLRPGEILLIPDAGHASPLLTAKKKTKVAASTKKTAKIQHQHIVRSGDTAGDVAHLYNVKTADVLRWNNLDKRGIIRPGQKLTVLINASENSRKFGYQVKSGDSLSVIASRF
ncbi:MAG: transglycosylase SLT domain-containing protein, partial [Spongiibacteraceae bacterium]